MAVVPECEYSFCDMARTLRMGENTFRRPCNFKELRVVKGHILQLLRYVRDGSLCTASAEQIFPRDSVQRNCFKLALYTTRDHDCISNRIGSGIRNCPRCGCRVATFGALPTPSTIYRAIIMLNNHRFWDMLLAPHHHQVRRSHRSIHCWHGHAAAPYRASGLVLWHFSDLTARTGDFR